MTRPHRAAPLAIGQSVHVHVPSDRLYVPTGVVLKRGARYAITADDQLWRDWKYTSDAEGRDKPTLVQSLVQWALRCKAGRWFQLIGAAGRSTDHLFPIGKHLLWTSDQPAGDHELELHFFANDAWFAYWNNDGAVNVTVTRIG